MNRNEAWILVQSMVKNRNLIKHMLATEACLRALARRLDENEEQWGLAGLIHDLDYEQTKNDPARHGIVSTKLLESRGIDAEIIHAVLAHAGHAPLESTLDKALYAADPLTGLIVAAALMHPKKSLAGLDTGFILRRFKEKKFAAGANREQIKTGTGLGLSLEEFITVCLNAMQGISDQLEL
ncbi:phosphohydrolase [candidate division WOR-3 bacterium JGI_Cruoil_03_51_56]|uniref:Phosphohydrolase n=1 Tax=candidate division WOR-3 bacterium JGI_Cruoil_03_51_56 TaxID=1973747 RepID=A0A235BXI3_UNCW3|nr:MAG: phosphohydrolase [candidate division WOR-3 bacterium JGI_Cruoil_03_51_56]